MGDTLRMVTGSCSGNVSSTGSLSRADTKVVHACEKAGILPQEGGLVEHLAHGPELHLLPDVVRQVVQQAGSGVRSDIPV